MSENALDIQNEKVNFQPLQTMAWLLLGLCSLLVVVGLILLFQPDIPRHPEYRPWESVLQYIAALVMVSIGTLIIRRYPCHPIGWLFSMIALLLALDMFAFSYATYGLISNPGSLPFAAVMAEFADDLSFIIQYGLILVLLLFPDGRFLSIRWRTFALVLGLLIVYAKIIWLLEPGLLNEFLDVINPFGMSRNLHNMLRPHAGFISTYLLPVSLFVSVISVVIRFRGAGETVRQQIKWFSFGVTPFVLGSIFLLVFQTQTSFGALIFVTVGLISAPIAIAIAIFKYRLFEIDIIINRTLVYGALTVLIFGLYALVVGGFGNLFRQNSALASLLITAVIFLGLYRPLRSVIQRGVNRIINLDDQPMDRVSSHRIETVIKQEGIIRSPSTFRNDDKEKPLPLWMVWLLWLLLIAIGIASFTLLASNQSIPVQDRWGFRGFQSLWGMIMGTVGVIIMWRHSHNPIGWLLYLIGILDVFIGLGEDYAAYALITSPGLPGGIVVGILANYFWIPIFTLGTLTFLLLPNGQFLSKGWKLIGWLSVFLIIPWSIRYLIEPGPLENLGFITNPLGIPNLEMRFSWFSVTPFQWMSLSLFVMFLAVLSLFVRYRRADTEGRLQIKWIALSGVLVVIGSLLGYISGPIADTVVILLFSAPPIAIGVSIFRYRLYDIDIIINRSLVYGALTALIVGVYTLSVGIMGLVVQTWDNLIGLLLTAVVVVIFFKPVRAGIQKGVDRVTVRNQPETHQVPPKEPVELSNVRLSKKWLQIGRVGWIILAIVALFFLLTSLPGYFPKIGFGLPGHGTDLDPTMVDTVLRSLGSVASLLSAVISLTLAGLLFRHSFENPAVAAISFYLLLYGVIMTGVLEIWGIHWVGTSDFVLTIQGMLMATPTVALLVLFPNGKFVPGWTRWLLLISVPWNFIGFFLPTLDSFEENVLTISLLLIAWLLLPGLGLYAQIYRYRKVSTPDERQQTKWVLFGFALWTLYIVISTYPYFYLTSLPPGAPLPWWTSISTLGWWLSTAILPVTMTIAVTRSRLWNIDVVINRTLVYGTLTAATMALYVLVVGTLGNLLQVGNSTFIAFLTTGLVAILFQPLRERLQGGVNRMMYGERDNPVAVLSKLGEELEHTGSPEDALSGITETVAQTLKLPYVAIELGDNNEIAASYGIPKPDVLRLPMLYQTETSGYLVVAQRSPGESFSTTDRQLLENIAHQAGAAAHAAKLTADLRLSRQRLVTAREEERRRLRRDLHDGLGPTLASLTLKMDATRNLLRTDPEKAEQLLDELKKQTQGTIQDVRSLVYELRPPALDELGLIGAIRNFIDNQIASQPQITLDVPDQLPPLPAAFEVAVYRIALEGITNSIRHAEANHAEVSISLQETQLTVEIIDDGVGLPDDFSAGVGLASMRERAEELGGIFELLPSTPGVHIRTRLPLPEE